MCYGICCGQRCRQGLIGERGLCRMLALHGAQSLSGSKCYWLCILRCCIVTGGIIVG